MTDTDDLHNRFTYHPPAPGADVPALYEVLRDSAHLFALLVDEAARESRERSLALTHIEEAVMWANAAIARHGAQNSPDWLMDDALSRLRLTKPDSTLLPAAVEPTDGVEP